MPVQIQFRRDTAANWTSNNPTLAIGELGLETDTSQIKVGDGTTAWNSLGYGGVQGPTGPTGATGAQGATGPTGPSGVISVTGPITNSGTSTAAQIGLDQTALGINASQITRTINTITANYSITANDANEILRSTAATGITVTVDDVLAVGQTVDVLQDGAGLITFAAGSGVTLAGSGNTGVNLITVNQYEIVTIICVAAGEYRLIGNIAAA